MPTSSYRFGALVASLALVVSAPSVRAQSLTANQQLGRDLLRELVETNTTYSAGSTTKAANLLAARFRAAGFPAGDVIVVGPDTGRDAKDKNLIVRLRGRGARKPVLLIGHLDVVEARRADWVLDPFVLTERDGHFYGRGTLDMKNGDASWVAALLRMKKEGFVPSGDYVLALTAGEEGGGGYTGIEWLLKNQRQLLGDPGYVLNADAGGGQIRNGKPESMDVQAAEKVFQTYFLTVRNPGGHSSLPEKDNAIYRLSKGLIKIGDYSFPIERNEVTRTYFSRTAALNTGELAKELTAVGAADLSDKKLAEQLAARSPFYNAQLRTTCVATMIEGGHARNALPQRVAATVNCRIMPGDPATDVEAALRRVIADSAVVITRADTAKPSPPSPLPKNVEETIRTVTTSIWGALPIIPNMETGATDGLYLRNVGIPVYGVSGYFADPNISDDNRAHGLNERISVKGFYDQLEFTYRLLKGL
jgi:acetylornithine deacetylase/succinyl-diaminopimelate desuccinylase-like protein